MSDSSTLPFELSADSLAGWLESIRLLQPVNAGTQLNQALIQIRKTPCDSSLLLSLLVSLTPATLAQANALIASIQSGPQNAKTIKVIRLILQLFRHLSLAFYALLKSSPLSMPQKLQACYLSLQLIGQHIRVSGLFYELPSVSLWNKSSELYLFAQANQGLDTEIDCKLADFRLQSTIAAVLKRNLLFTFLTCHQPGVKGNQALFTFANQYAHLLEFSAGTGNSCRFVWHLHHGLPFTAIQNQQYRKPTEISLYTGHLLDHLNDELLRNALTAAELERLEEHLSVYQELSNGSLPSSPIRYTLITGFKAVCDTLSIQEKIHRLHVISAQLKDNQRISPLTLEPSEFEKSLLNNVSLPSDNASQSGLDRNNMTVQVLQSKNQRFVHAECKRPGFSAGEIAVLINHRNEAMVGIIRQLNKKTGQDAALLLIERITGTITTHTIRDGQYQDIQAMVVNETTDHAEILLRFDKFRNGTEFSLNNKTVRLVSLVEYSSSLVRYNVVFDSSRH